MKTRVPLSYNTIFTNSQTAQPFFATESGTMMAVIARRSAVCCKLGRYADAMSDAEIAISMEDDYQKAHLRKAAAHMGLKQFEEAETVLSGINM